MLLKGLAAGDAYRKNAEQIDKCAQMATTLTRQLLTYSRKQVVAPRILELNTIVINIEAILRRFITRNIEFCSALQPDAGYINVDPGQIEQISVNLAVNARDAMPNGGNLTILTANVTLEENNPADFPHLGAGNYVTLAIADTGTGMTDEVKARILEPFFTTKAPDKGTGLGLATCFEIVKQSNAYIQVRERIRERHDV